MTTINELRKEKKLINKSIKEILDQYDADWYTNQVNVELSEMKDSHAKEYISLSEQLDKVQMSALKINHPELY